jgi:benzaldehyde dehydrogenase (NAD)
MGCNLTRRPREVFLKALEIGRANSDEIIDWIVRERRLVPAKAGFELSVTLKSIQLAAAMPHQAQGLVLPGDRAGPAWLVVAR